MKIRFLRTTELLVLGGPLQYGAMEEEAFPQGAEHEVELLDQDGDMASFRFADGRRVWVLKEDFTVVE